MGISLGRRVGLCAHDHYLPDIVEGDLPSGLDRRDGITVPRTHKPAAGPKSEECHGKRVPSFIRLVFAMKCLEEGDNCLLTSSSAYVDLPFSPLIA